MGPDLDQYKSTSVQYNLTMGEARNKTARLKPAVQVLINRVAGI